MLCRVKVSDGLFTFALTPPNPPTHTITDLGFSQLSHFPEPRQRRLLPALPWCCVALGRLEQPLIADACLERLRLRTWEKPAERWCSLCAHTHRACVRVCVSVCVCGTGVRRKAFSSSGWKEAAVYLLSSRTLPQTRPPPLGDVRPGQGVPRMHKPTHAKVLFSRFCSFIQWSHDPRAMILQRAWDGGTDSRCMVAEATVPRIPSSQEESNLQNLFFCLCFTISPCAIHVQQHLLSLSCKPTRESFWISCLNRDNFALTDKNAHIDGLWGTEERHLC